MKRLILMAIILAWFTGVAIWHLLSMRKRSVNFSDVILALVLTSSTMWALFVLSGGME